MKKLILITCYFGSLPSYFDFYMKSVEQNSTVDFLLVTDDNGTQHILYAGEVSISATDPTSPFYKS